MAAYEKMAKIAQSLLPGIDPRAMPHNPDTMETSEKAIGVNEAMKLLEANNQLNLTYGEDANKQLAISNNLINLPQVIANRQVGNMDDTKLVKMGKAHHRSRRAEELGIDEEGL